MYCQIPKRGVGKDEIMTKNVPGIVLYHEYLDQIAMLTQAERGSLLTAILEYAKGGNESLTQEMSDKTKLVFSIIRKRIDLDVERYRKRCSANDSFNRNRGYNRREGTSDSESHPLNLADFIEN